MFLRSTPRVVLASLILTVAVLARGAPVHAQATLISGLGGPAGFGPAGSCLARNDDGYSHAIDVTSVFPTGLNFFGTTYRAMYVNTNGSISFRSGISTFTPSAFPGAPQPMIAPFWADVDTCRSHTGTCGIGYMDVTATPCPNDTDDEVWWDLDTAGGRIIVTWQTVGYYSAHTDHRMNFQLILSHATGCGGMGAVGNFDVEFRFNRCEWETGDASGGTGGFGGTPAQSGFDSGMAMWMGRPAYVSLPGSRMPGIARALCTGSNLTPAMPGIWRFTIRDGGVNCPNAGMPCNTGRPGICAAGATQCVGSGTMCIGLNSPRARACNGLDNDCDGMVDTGDTLCPAGQVCDGSACVPRCVEGGCFAGQTCTSRGTCVETACVSVMCPAGQRCMGGRCVGECDGVTCPTGQVCRLGRCVDPCAGLMCAMGTVCENGVCQPNCGACRPCGTGQACDMRSGRCVPAGCETMTCPAGQVCTAGHCADACMGAVCPMGGTCMNGMCMDAPMSMSDGGTGSDSGGMGDTGMVVDPRADAGGDFPDADTTGDGATTDARRRGDGGGTTDTGGCACRAAGAPGSSSHTRNGAGALAAFAAMAALGASRRRRRRRA